MCLLTFSLAAQKKENSNSAISRNLELFNDIYKQLDLFYVDSLNADTVIGWGIRAMLQQVDPFTDYFPEDKMFGYVMENELKAIDGVMENPARPFCAIIGGSKVSTKITIIEKLMEKVDSIIIGGGMTYTFAGSEGGKVGKSICEPDMFPVALEILKKAEEKGIKILRSPDALICDDFAETANTQEAPANNIPDEWEGVDIASQGKAKFREHILGCKTILWNGPVGVFEINKFSTGSRAVAEAIAEATEKNGAYSLIGGGDSVACVNKFGLADKVSYVSTGGGALLEYMEGKELPGVAAIRK